MSNPIKTQVLKLKQQQVYYVEQEDVKPML